MLQKIIFFIAFQLIFCSAIYGQFINQTDSINQKIGLWVYSDIENVKFEEKVYTCEGVLEYKKIFSRNGDEIVNYSNIIDINILNQIKNKIKQYFVMSDINEASGKVVSFLIIDCNRNIYEIRTTKGITKYFNEEYLKAAKLTENDLKLICEKEQICEKSYVIPFTVEIYGNSNVLN